MCTVDGCESPVKARGYCGSHYARLMRYGNPLIARGKNISRAPAGEAMRFLRDLVDCRRDECVPWPFGQKGNGYGEVVITKGRKTTAHRAALAMLTGGERQGLDAAHNCGNGHLGCVNPYHLYWATKPENMADRERHGTLNRGGRNGQSKLSDAQVISIHKDPRSQYVIAQEHGVCQQLVSSIKTGKRWGWLTAQEESST